MIRAMNATHDNAREIALRAQVDAARADADAVRKACAMLANHALTQRERVAVLEGRLARIARHAKDAHGLTRCQVAAVALSAIANTADPPPPNVIEFRR